jgi:parallel beta-helix repeat protein
MCNKVRILIIIILFTSYLALESIQVDAQVSYYIHEDGSITPSDDSFYVQGNTLTITENVEGAVYVLKNDLVIDGSGFTLSEGELYLNDIENITLKNLKLHEANVYVNYSDSVLIQNNSISKGVTGIYCYKSNNISIIDNEIENTHRGIHLYETSFSQIIDNVVNVFVTHGFELYEVTKSTFSDNVIRGESGNAGVRILSCRDNEFSGNVIVNPVGQALSCMQSISNRFFNNHFEAFRPILSATSGMVNIWDNGTHGNYWSDYTGEDEDGNGIGDTWYSINDANMDMFPLIITQTVPTETVPGTIQQLFRLDGGSSWLYVDWDPPDDGGSPILEYEIEYWVNVNDKTLSIHGPHFNHINIIRQEPNTRVYFRVRAVNSIGPGFWSPEHSWLTDEISDEREVVTISLEQPTGNYVYGDTLPVAGDIHPSINSSTFSAELYDPYGILFDSFNFSVNGSTFYCASSYDPNANYFVVGRDYMAGTWTVKVCFSGNEQYTEAEDSIQFQIVGGRIPGYPVESIVIGAAFVVVLFHARVRKTT